MCGESRGAHRRAACSSRPGGWRRPYQAGRKVAGRTKRGHGPPLPATLTKPQQTRAAFSLKKKGRDRGGAQRVPPRPCGHPLRFTPPPSLWVAVSLAGIPCLFRHRVPGAGDVSAAGGPHVEGSFAPGRVTLRLSPARCRRFAVSGLGCGRGDPPGASCFPVSCVWETCRGAVCGDQRMPPPMSTPSPEPVTVTLRRGT